MQRVPTASRRLLVLVFALAGLALPSAAGSQTDVGSITAVDHEEDTRRERLVREQRHRQLGVRPAARFVDPAATRSRCTDGTTGTLSHLFRDVGQTAHDSSDASTIKIDKTAPAVHAVPSRPPDANGWYNHPVAVSFAGSDATSGLAGGCSSTTYSGPDNGNASVAGTCTDNAGNVGHAAYGLAYDATPPTLAKVTAKHGDRSVLLGWKASPDTQVGAGDALPGLEPQQGDLPRHGAQRSGTSGCGPARSTTTR